MKNILLTATFSITIVTLFLAPAGTNLAFAGLTCEEECGGIAQEAFKQCLGDNPDEPENCDGVFDEIFRQCFENCLPEGECQIDIDCEFLNNACETFGCETNQCVQISGTLCSDDFDICTLERCDPDDGCIVEPNPICEEESPVAGELLPLDNTALFLAGIQSMTVWMVPTVLGLAGVGEYLVKFRKH